jgi:hypothetical protein
MSGIDGSPSNARSCPFTFTLTIRPSAGGSFYIAGCRLSARNVAESAVGPGAPPCAVTKAERVVLLPRFPPVICCLFFLLLVKGCSGNQTNHARDGSKRIGVNKTNSKTRMLDRRPFVESGRIFS